MSNDTNVTAHLAEYRKWLVEAEQKAQEDFDKTILSLSGGALGISFVFLKDVIGSHPIVLSQFLLASWLAWAFSTFAVLTSYYLSHLSLRRAISQVDAGTIYTQKPGGVFARSTAVLNAAGALLFLIGVCCITTFAGYNVATKGANSERKEETACPSPNITITTTAGTATSACSSTGSQTRGDNGLHSAPTSAITPAR